MKGPRERDIIVSEKYGGQTDSNSLNRKQDEEQTVKISTLRETDVRYRTYLNKPPVTEKGPEKEILVAVKSAA